MYSSSGPRGPSILERNTGTKPKSKTCKLFSPLKKQSKTIATTNQNAKVKTPALSASIKKSPKRCLNEEDRQQFLKSNSTPRSTSSTLEKEDFGNEMGLIFEPSCGSLADDGGMSFLKFESLYTMEKELMLTKNEAPQRLEERSSVCAWYEARDCDGKNATKTSWPDRTFEDVAAESPIMAVPAKESCSMPLDGFSFAPGWVVCTENLYQWQQSGKTTKQVSPMIFSYLAVDQLFSQILYILELIKILTQGEPQI